MTATHQWTRRSPFLPQCQPRYINLNLAKNGSQTNPAINQLIASVIAAAPPPLRAQIQQLLRYFTGNSTA